MSFDKSNLVVFNITLPPLLKLGRSPLGCSDCHHSPHYSISVLESLASSVGIQQPNVPTNKTLFIQGVSDFTGTVHDGTSGTLVALTMVCSPSREQFMTQVTLDRGVTLSFVQT